ncbi:hypothetical protein [Fulvivirga sediminis]|uniref:Uncharacterized protein n=1 Tax=Fulvivirga sediminis TaxID=2803949 RepID=A0A937K1W2_9BACT|nr:hypothetical protein [Fulvivirga sediminis]MBL3657132.1 hypothetical protein [Fulvivirga sediminis]
MREIQFYIHELKCKIEELKRSFNYVPEQATYLLSQYKEVLEDLLILDYKNSY